MQTSGVESIQASAIGVTRFVAPGPEVAIATPAAAGGARVALRHVPAPCSWRASTWRTVVPRAIAS